MAPVLKKLFSKDRPGSCSLADVDGLLQQAKSQGTDPTTWSVGLQPPSLDNSNRLAQDFAQAVRLLNSLTQQVAQLSAHAGLGVSEPVRFQAPVSLANNEHEHEAPLLADEIQSHLADLERRKLSPDTIIESRHSLKLFLAMAGNIQVSQIRAAHARSFLDAVRWWPSRASNRPEYRGLSVEQIVARGKEEGVPAPSSHTLNKHCQRLGTFLNALVAMDHLHKNPLKGLKPSIETDTDLDTGRPFQPSELCFLFQEDRYRKWASKLPHRWWGPMIGLYSGARVNEVAQIYVDDIREVSGVWGIFLWKNARGQKIKNKSSIRFVPLAKPLLEAGFLDFLSDMKEAGHARLFPHLPSGTRKDGSANNRGYGRQLSRQFSVYAKASGIEGGTGFHAFRHTFSTMLAEADVSPSDIAMITGHAVRGQAPVLEKHYIHIAKPASLPQRMAVLDKFNPGVRLPAYQKNQFSLSLSRRLHD